MTSNVKTYYFDYFTQLFKKEHKLSGFRKIVLSGSLFAPLVLSRTSVSIRIIIIYSIEIIVDLRIHQNSPYQIRLPFPIAALYKSHPSSQIAFANLQQNLPTAINTLPVILSTLLAASVTFLTHLLTFWPISARCRGLQRKILIRSKNHELSVTKVRFTSLQLVDNSKEYSLYQNIH